MAARQQTIKITTWHFHGNTRVTKIEPRDFIPPTILGNIDDVVPDYKCVQALNALGWGVIGIVSMTENIKEIWMVRDIQK